MRILSRYILKEIFAYSLLGLLIFTFIIFVRQIGHLLELVARHNLSALSVLLLASLPMPSILVLTIPMSVLVGTLIGLSRMAADGEVIAARALGLGLGQFVRPVMIFALAGSAVALWMSLSLAPRAVRRLNRMESSLKSSQVPYEIQPRVFIEEFPKLLLYLEDVTGSHLRWRGVFIADSTERDALKITLAESGGLVNDSASNRLTLHLTEGTTHEIDPRHPEQYSVISFTQTDIPIPVETSAASTERQAPPLLIIRELIETIRNPPDPETRRAALVELHYRLALPMASLVLALVGIPLGLYTRKGGKAFGLIVTVLLVFVYYILMAFGLSFSKQGRLDPALGIWLANAVFGLVGIAMLAEMRHVRQRFDAFQEWMVNLGPRLRRRSRKLGEGSQSLLGHRAAGGGFMQIIDSYIIRDWLFYLAILLAAFTGVYVIFDFFQLLSDIVRNQVPVGVVLDYCRFLVPEVIYLMLPLSILVATLVTFGLLAKTNQITAIKSAGISLYRISTPVLLAAAALSVGMFLLDNQYLPEINQRQDALRNRIKGRPPQTYYRPDRQWIFGQSNRIYNYRFFDPDHNVFANLSIFDFDPQNLRMTRRVYAARAFWEASLQGWVIENGWIRTLAGDRVTSFTPFSVMTIKDLTEEPAYFKKEVKPSAQMSALELRAYIDELSRSGFDVVRLSVQLYRKFSFPLIAFVVALIGIPFSFSAGRKGALSGMAVSIGIAIIYWSTSSLFEAMGNLNQLPPVVAAWSPDVLFGLGGVYLLLRMRT
jgi:LPS export ABC transporter permease LptF/LPS export ABC transporter permease LptG